jgi:hypothetical protein
MRRPYKERARAPALQSPCHPVAIRLRPASCACFVHALQAICDPLPFGLRLQHILSSDASKFVKEEYPIHKTLKQTKTNKPKRK